MATATPEQKFWSRVQKGSDDQCWLWTGHIQHKGYGEFYFRAGTVKIRCRAHRWAYELLAGPIPSGLVIDHTCRVRSCVNPAHMEPVTNEVNIERGDWPALVAARAAQTHCAQGHEFTEANTRYAVKARGGLRRRCRECARVQARDRYRRSLIAA